MTDRPAGSDRRWVIFFFEGWVGVQPTLINLARSLSGTGYTVTIYGTPTSYPDPGDLGPGVQVQYLAPGHLVGLVQKLAALPGLGRLGGLSVTLAATDFALRSCYEEVRHRWRFPSRTVYVGVDSRGAMAASLSSWLLRRPFAFLSLELRLTPKQLAGLRGVVGRATFKRAACVVVQGQDRLEVLFRQFGWKHDKVIFLPNGPLPGSKPSRPDANVLRKRLAISPRMRIALQAGMIDDATCSRELNAGFSALPDWALVFHERHRRSPDEPYLAQLREANPRNLFLSLEPVPYDDVDQIYAAADVGLAFYRPAGPHDDNFSQISSSGKLPHYLHQGKPVLMSNLPYMVQLADEFGCGIIIQDPSDSEELGRALEQISSRYAEFSRNARACYDERFDFSRGARQLTQFFDQP